MIEHRFLGQTIIVSVAIVLCCSEEIFAQKAVTLDDVLRVWQKREDATRSLHFVMTDEHLMIWDSPAPFRSTFQRVLTIDGSKMRTEYTGAAWVDTIQASQTQVTIGVFDGLRQKSLSKWDRNDDELHAQGWIYKSEMHSDTTGIYLSPILRHYRPISPRFKAIKIDSLQVLSNQEQVDGLPCVLLQETWKDGPHVGKYWVAPDRDMGIVRYEHYFDGRKYAQAEVEYSRDSRLGWMPHRWKAALFHEDKLQSSGELAVTRSEINASYPDATFDLEFPPGTEVFDRISKTTFIVRADSSRREVLPAESRAKFTELMNTSMGEAIPQSNDGQDGSIVVVVIALIVVTASIIALVIRRSRATTV